MGNRVSSNLTIRTKSKRDEICKQNSESGKELLVTKRKKIIIGIFTPIAALVLAFCVLCFVTMGMYSPVYLGRVLGHWDSSVTDYKIFPRREIAPSGQPYRYEYEIRSELSELAVGYTSGKKSRVSALSALIEKTATTSLIVVKDDKVVYERYANGYDSQTTNTSFSMSKSVVSLLVGKAVEEGYIRDIGQPVSDYISELAGTAAGRVTIRELLSMRSGITYEEDGFLWFGDDSLTYWHPDLRRLALSHTGVTDRYRGKFHYNNYHPLLLGIVLERSTGVSVSEYFAEKIWKPVGAEYAASWSLDGKKSGFEKMESGINFRAIDFVKIGSMVLHEGVWNGNRIVAKDWLIESASCEFPLNGDEYADSFLADRNIGYKYMWYCLPSPQSGYDIMAWGKSDQILYVSPANGVVILRTGKTDGGVSDWEKVMQQISSALN